MKAPTLRDLEDWNTKCDDAADAHVQEQIDDEAELAAKRQAAQFSPEQMSLQDAFIEGQRAGTHGTASALNPYDHGFPEHAEWERGRMGALSRKVA